MYVRFSPSVLAPLTGFLGSLDLIDANRHTTDAALGALIFWKNLWSECPQISFAPRPY